MRLLVVGKAVGDNTGEDLRRLEYPEGKMLWEYYQSGILQQAYFCVDWNCSFFVLECRSRTEARQLIEQLPTFKAGLYEYKVDEVKPLPAMLEIANSQNLAVPQWLNF